LRNSLNAILRKEMADVKGLDEADRIVLFNNLRSLYAVEEQHDDDVPIESVFGLWKNRDITAESLRQKAWN
jgi:hypothetical protein